MSVMGIYAFLVRALKRFVQSLRNPTHPDKRIDESFRRYQGSWDENFEPGILEAYAHAFLDGNRLGREETLGELELKPELHQNRLAA